MVSNMIKIEMDKVKKEKKRKKETLFNKTIQYTNFRKIIVFSSRPYRTRQIKTTETDKKVTYLN